MSIRSWLERQPKLAVLFAGFALIGVIGFIDFISGYEFAFSVFYVLPIALITWRAGRRFGLAAAIISAIVWLGADLGTGHTYSQPFIPLWNTLIRFANFIIVMLLLDAFKQALQRAGALARIDYLTGAVNARSFHEAATVELDRLRRYRHAFTVAYLDLDNFKTVNDQLGHTTGDRALRAATDTIRQNIRRTDLLARLGGDEFVVLFPETDQAAAAAVLTKVHTALLQAMRQHGWPITFSVGVLTCTTAPASTDALVKLADDVMYRVKHNGKQAVEYEAYAG